MHDEKNLHYKESLERLAMIKDRIVAYWQWQSMDDARKNLWMGDVQEVYYQLFTVWDLQRQNSREKNSDYNAIQLTLGTAKSRLEQVLSELNAVNDRRAVELRRELRDAFDEFWKPLAIDAGIKELLSEKLLRVPSVPVIEIDGAEYHLPCAICSEIAFVFRLEIPHHASDERLVYKGLTHTSDFERQYASRIFKMLRRHDIAGVHRRMKFLGAEEGIDAYCPECNKVYCHGHYWLKEIWEEGFYDCTIGACPEGHKRIVDD